MGKKVYSRELATSELADLYRVQGATIRRSLCIKGHYLGLIPLKLPNGRLLWPNCPPEQLQRYIRDESGDICMRFGLEPEG